MTGNHAIKLPPQRQQKFDEYLASGAREHQQCREQTRSASVIQWNSRVRGSSGAGSSRAECPAIS